MASSYYVPPPLNTFHPGPPPQEQKYAYIFLRVLAGLGFFYYGFLRIFTGTGLAGSVDSMLQTMNGARLPSSLLLTAGYVVPCVELGVGALLIAGVGLRYALVGAYLLLLVLLFGICWERNWSAAGAQVLYGLVLAFLLLGRRRYDSSWAEIFRRKTP
jgi:thiosulfate dehydrogenase [quinone] large subunit